MSSHGKSRRGDVTLERRLSGKERPAILLGLFENESPPVMEGILSESHRYGWQLVNLSSFDGFLPSYVNPQGILDTHIAGESEVEELRAQGCPMVRLGSMPHPDDHVLPAVLPDLKAAGKMAATHLVERGFKALGFLGYTNMERAKLLWEGFHEQAMDLGCTCDRLDIGGEAERGVARQERRRKLQHKWLKNKPKPFGIFTYEDTRAAQICNMCLSAGIGVPEEVAILSYGNNPYICETAPVELSSVDPNLETYGREAARLLNRLMNGENAPGQPIMIPPKGISLRQSTDVLAVPHPVVAKALRYIWGNFEKPLSITDIARNVGVSRRGLDRAFQRHLGRTANAEVARKRLERCAELLRGTELAVGDIAAMTGFATETYLYREFRKVHGMTPRQYRLQSR